MSGPRNLLLSGSCPSVSCETPASDCCTTAAFAGAAPIALPFEEPPTGVTNSIYSQAFDLSDASIHAPAFLTAFGGTAASASAALIDAINDNTAYLNIHTTQFPGGKIHGFLVAAPIREPAI